MVALIVSSQACDDGQRDPESVRIGEGGRAERPDQFIDAGEARPSRPDPEGVEAGPTDVLRLSPQDVIGWNGDQRGRRFATSATCSACHSNHFAATAMRDSAGEEIAPFNLWQGTMMANAARDPLWHAQVSAETKAHPEKQAEIEAKCMRCHAPMASENALDEGEQPTMAQLYTEGSVDAVLGLDGVACPLCHQIEGSNFGTMASFSGGYKINRFRRIFGPHEDPAPGPMLNHVEYRPSFGEHMTESALCGTCHTLFTEPLSETGEPVEGVKFPEQTTFLEWKNSAYAGTEYTCQGCHMPTTDPLTEAPIETRIARSPPGGDFRIDPREPFGQHFFVGGNTLMPQILINERETLRPQASDEAFQATRARALAYLQSRAIRSTLVEKSVEDGVARFTVKFENLAGHKFPTGMPIRRAWVRVKARNESGDLVFSSGDFNEAGRLINQHGEVLDIEKVGGDYEPHHDEISRFSEVQIYEAIMHDSRGEQTYGLLRATGFLKDNRFLPTGYVRSGDEHHYTQSHGVEDESFQPGADQVTYRFSSEGAERLSVEVELFFQSVSARFIRERLQIDTPQVRAFRSMYERADLTPVPATQLSFELP